VATTGGAVLERLSESYTPRAAAGAAPETPRIAAGTTAEADPNIVARLDAIHVEQRNRILREVAAGRRPTHAAPAPGVDFATARTALAEGFSRNEVTAWLASKRAEKDSSYPARTVMAAGTFKPGSLG
jgi:hypothetical protein